MPTTDKPIWNTGLINNGKLEQVYEMAIVKHGHWEMIVDDRGGFVDWKCSVCGGSGRGDYFICPWCGAKMDEVEDAE